MAGIQVKINEIGLQGDGAGIHRNKPIYVAKTTPGDVVLVQGLQETSDAFTAKLLEIQTPGPDRIAPPCPHYERCGGCGLQHVNENFYRNWKIEKVKTTLSRAGVVPEKFEEPVFLSNATRRRTSVAAVKSGNQLRMGYNELRSHNVLDIKKCLVLDSRLDEKLQALRPFLLRILPEKKQADILLQHAGHAFDLVITGKLKEKNDFSLEQLETFAEMAESLGLARISVRDREFAEAEIVLTREAVTKKFGALEVKLPPAAFLQASLEGEKALIGAVMKYADDTKNVVDLFSGSGTFTGGLLESAAQVSAFDGDAAAIAALSATKHPKLSVSKRDLFKDPLSALELKKFDTAIFDPPRAGAKEQTQQLAQSGIPKIIGVSCNPSTFARDAKALLEAGYSLKSLTIIDQFVWSAHTEIAGVFTRKT